MYRHTKRSNDILKLCENSKYCQYKIAERVFNEPTVTSHHVPFYSVSISSGLTGVLKAFP